MATTLLMRLDGAMQSWGTQSSFEERDTELEPSKSGVIGLICAALGRPRWEAVDDLAALRMGVRIDRRSREIHREYQTIGGFQRPEDEAVYGIMRADGIVKPTIQSNRYYLPHPVFLVGFEGDAELLRQIHEALGDPVWQLYLGRKSYVPSKPVQLSAGDPGGSGLIEASLEAALAWYPWLGYGPWKRDIPKRICVALDGKGRHSEIRHDVPVSFETREFTTRHVKFEWWSLKEGGEGYYVPIRP